MFDGAQVVVKVLHAGVDRTVGEDLELMTACAEFLDRQDPEIARYRPITVVEEFNKMMRGAIDMAQELGNLQLFAKNFASEHDVVIPTPYPERSTRRVLTMTRIVGRTFTDRNALDADGWDVDRLVRRAIAIYLEMIFRDGVFHADPHPGNFLLLPGHRIGILDFGDVGYITAAVKMLTAKYALAPARIYGIGHSNGAMMIERMMCESNVFAAAIAISFDVGSQLGGCSTAPSTPAASISPISSSAV